MAKKKTNRAGGSATGGGMNFQAAVTTIASIHMSCGSPLKWLDGVTDDTPIEVFAETGGAGDDLKINFQNELTAEIQIKKGLRKGQKLWETLTKLALAISKNEINFGVLIVCPESSQTIRLELATDIRRLGGGRTDNLKPISQEFFQTLQKLGLSTSDVCQKLRIVTVHALVADQASIETAMAMLENICAQKKQIQATWGHLYEDAHRIIEDRSARTTSSILRLLESLGIQVRSAQSSRPLPILSRLADWTIKANEFFSIWGIKRKLSLNEHWIDIPIVVSADENTEGADADISDALLKYHDWAKRKLDTHTSLISPITLGRFYRHVVVVSGPGMGKSTLLKKLAIQYASEGLPTVKVNLRLIAQRMRTHGEGFKESALKLGLANSGISSSDLTAAAYSDLVFLCDGLDECGHDRAHIAEELTQLALGHPEYRIIVTTRPIGYRSAMLEGWRHYEILPLPKDTISKELSTMIENIVGNDDIRAVPAQKYAKSYFNNNPVGDLIARSPLLLSLIASLSINGVPFEQRKSRLYAEIFKLFDAEPNDKLESENIDGPTVHRVLDILAFTLIQKPTVPTSELYEQCAQKLAAELNCTQLCALKEVTRCVAYWEKIGVLEKLHYLQESIVTFVHLTFAEYAAARYICALPDNELSATLPLLLDSPGFIEAISFASETHKAEQIFISLRSSDSKVLNDHDTIISCLKIATLSEPPIRKELLLNLIDDGLIQVQSDRKSDALAVGKMLGQVAGRFPELFGSELEPLFQHVHAWTRLVAWYCAVRAGEQFYTLDALVEAATSLDQEFEPLRPSLGGGVALNIEGPDLFRSFRLQTAKQLFARASDQQASDALEKIFGDGMRISVGEFQKLEELSEDYDREHILPSPWKQKSFGDGKVLERFKRTSNAMEADIKQWLELIAAHSFEGNGKRAGYLFNLAALLEQSNFWETTPSETRLWSKPQDLPLIQEVFEALIEVSSIPRSEIGHEAKAYLNDLEGSESFLFSSLSDRAPHVDVPLPDWTGKTFKFDKSILRKACFHRSTWIAKIAAYILANTLDQNELLQLSKDLITKGKRETLFIAATLAEQADNDQIAASAFKRLQTSPESGYEYLFEFFCSAPPRWDKETFQILNLGLLCSNPYIASSAAKLAQKYASQESPDLYALLQKAYNHWQKTEKPYPSNGGVVPKSPRDVILQAMTAMEPPTYPELLSYMADARPDVRGVAQPIFIERIKNDMAACQQLVQDATQGKTPTHLLSDVLRSNVDLTPDQVETLKCLLYDQDAKKRFAAMNLLDSKYMARDEIVSICQTLFEGDPHQQIRNRAHGIISEITMQQ
ncbi:NACHT domain-containing protein [Eilatimonas milleporae]|uniref:NACHT domain-containing protein n=1 Tax=Eilatimonas milleporae TaxID=911205 RepID=A0A3M0BWM1_9PROT|nr:NACHT domain-containing protein [Eilatimonas milleporae]RMB01492.1 NACHT domain-containing protein [Eilatimonas milleporae]